MRARRDSTRNSRTLCIIQLVFGVGGILILAHQSEGVVEVGVPLPSLQQASGLELFEVGQVAQGSESKYSKNFRVVT